MRYLRRTIAGVRGNRTAFAIGLANGIGLLILVAVGYVYELSLTGWILGWLLVSGLMNILLAWNNERRTATGRDRGWNEIIGKPVVAQSRFQHHAGEYKGVVGLGSERWRAVSRSPLSEGQRLAVVGRRGLVLEVAPEADKRPHPGAR